MAKSSDQLRSLLDKLGQLPPPQLAEVEDFVDFLRYKDQDRPLTQAATRAAEPSFKQIWDNPDDAVYDTL
ncbi:MAG: toxin-antitoxin system, antitoxin component, Xre family protein [Gammaproteobacteria bacterium]|nr:toxin-antitoxin system, antitoxin component, Xre family protein [Gammaproteobacteria bacterium]